MKRKPFIVISYYTDDAIYCAHAQCWRDAVKSFQLPHHCGQLIRHKANWQQATYQKPRFVLTMMNKYWATYHAVIWLDIDAVILRRPELFWQLRYHNHTMGAVVDARASRWNTSVVYVRNSGRGRQMIERWATGCEKAPDNLLLGDQTVFNKIFAEEEIYHLPHEYGAVFDDEACKGKEDIVIQLNQASREGRVEFGDESAIGKKLRKQLREKGDGAT
jgi:lipopolysaccharide biosynthesis glycosyltransferase